MKHVCTLCKKWIPKLHQKSHLRWHVKNPHKTRYDDAEMVERAVSYRLHKLEKNN